MADPEVTVTHDKIPTPEEVAQMNLDIALQFSGGEYEKRGENEARLAVSTRRYTFDSFTPPDDEMREILDKTYMLAHARIDDAEESQHRNENGITVVTKRIPASVGIVFDEVTMYGGRVSPDRFVNFSVYVRRPEPPSDLHR